MTDEALAELIRDNAQLEERVENLEAQLLALAAIYTLTLTLLRTQ
jgi:hypothetical protein